MAPQDLILGKLNPQQRLAVETTEGPLLVFAGAGSGKTKVLTNRIAYLIENGVSEDNILAITFTNKASKEMREREVKILGKLAYDIQISTFHSFGLKLLKENYGVLGYSKNFNILDINLKDLNLAKLDSYNIMICINRVKDNNFIYII